MNNEEKEKKLEWKIIKAFFVIVVLFGVYNTLLYKEHRKLESRIEKLEKIIIAIEKK